MGFDVDTETLMSVVSVTNKCHYCHSCKAAGVALHSGSSDFIQQLLILACLLLSQSSFDWLVNKTIEQQVGHHLEM